MVVLRGWQGRNVVVCIAPADNKGLSATNALHEIREELSVTHGVPLDASWFDVPRATDRLVFPVEFSEGRPTWWPALTLPALARHLGIVEADLTTAFGWD